MLLAAIGLLCFHQASARLLRPKDSSSSQHSATLASSLLYIGSSRVYAYMFRLFAQHQLIPQLSST
jgi:hypothetical protein